MNTIKIYGPGCVKCTTFAELTKQAMRELQLEIPLEKVTDAMQFAVAGVLLTPALSVNGKILISGKVPTKEEIKNLLLKEKELWQDSPVKYSCSKNNTCGSAGCSSCDGAGCCEGSSSSGCNKWKKAIVWIVVLLTLLAVIKILNHQDAGKNTGSPTKTIPIKSSCSQ
ncbi:MAG: thioredoxin family protein [Akkermansia sp.]